MVRAGCHWRHGHLYCQPAVVIDFGRQHRRWQHDHDHDAITTNTMTMTTTTTTTTSVTERYEGHTLPRTVSSRVRIERGDCFKAEPDKVECNGRVVACQPIR